MITNFNMSVYLQLNVPLIDGPRETKAKPTQPLQPPGHAVKIVIGGMNSKLKNDGHNKTPGKIEGKKTETKKDKAGSQSSTDDDKTTVAVGYHKVPSTTPRFVVFQCC